MDPPIIAINLGDTVTWALSSGSTGSVAAVSGEWKSPVLTNVGSSFALTFTKAGVIAYRAPLVFAAVEVMPGVSNPPPITLNCPVDGSYLPFGFALQAWAFYVPLQASLNTTSAVDRVEFFAGNDLLGSVTNAPYQMAVAYAEWGYTVFRARLVTRAGPAFDSGPVRVRIGADILYRPRRLPGGSFLCYWSLSGPFASPPPPSPPMGIISASAPVLRDHVGFTDLPPVIYGVFYDETATNAPQRFYFLGTRP